jgi:hypothetical protein
MLNNNPLLASSIDYSYDTYLFGARYIDKIYNCDPNCDPTSISKYELKNHLDKIVKVHSTNKNTNYWYIAEILYISTLWITIHVLDSNDISSIDRTFQNNINSDRFTYHYFGDTKSSVSNTELRDMFDKFDDELFNDKLFDEELFDEEEDDNDYY